MSKVCHDIVHVSYLYGQIDRLMTDTVEATCTSWCKKLANRLSKIYFMETVSIFCNCEINDRYLDIYTVRPPSLLDTKKIKKLADRLSYTDYYTQRDHLHFSMQKIGWQIIKISSPCQYFTQIDSPASSPRNWHFFPKPFPFSAPIASFNNWTRMQRDQKVFKNKTKVCFWNKPKEFTELKPYWEPNLKTMSIDINVTAGGIRRSPCNWKFY